MSPGLSTIQMFWHGAPLSRLERLSMASFVANGHPVDLYVYDDPGAVPSGVRVRDANTVLDRSLIFRHRRTESVAIFADWFRYRLLHEKGGIWADTDVVCLKPFVYSQSEIFAWQDSKAICNAVLGLPPGHELAAWMAACCEDPNRLLPYDDIRIRLRKWRRRVLQANRRENIRYGENGPRGLTRAAQYFGYADVALPPWHFYPVHFAQWHVLFESGPTADPALPPESRAVHLWNNKISRERPGFDKNGRFASDSPFEQLCQRYLRSDG